MLVYIFRLRFESKVASVSDLVMSSWGNTHSVFVSNLLICTCIGMEYQSYRNLTNNVTVSRLVSNH